MSDKEPDADCRRASSQSRAYDRQHRFSEASRSRNRDLRGSERRSRSHSRGDRGDGRPRTQRSRGRSPVRDHRRSATRDHRSNVHRIRSVSSTQTLHAQERKLSREKEKLRTLEKEYGRQHIEVAKKIQRTDSSDDEEVPPVPDDKPPSAIIKENGVNGTKTTVIERQEILGPSPELNYKRSSSQERVQNGHKTNQGNGENIIEFHLANCLDLVKAGMESIIEDQVTSVFEAEELRSWNLLTRTNRQYEFLTWRLTIIWAMGFVVRYMFLLPLRIMIFVIGVLVMVLSTWVVSMVPYAPLRRKLGRISYKTSIRVLIRGLSIHTRFHNMQHAPRANGFCVANHTSPIDVGVLSVNTCFSLIGQRHNGFLGLLQRALARASPHIWFERSEVKDRHAVARRLKEHISVPDNPPILIFPEGTCINNTSVMQFKKGSFEVGGTIYPVAIKYDPRFGDAFWNSSRYGMLHYLLNMMTSWAIVCDVWYLPAMTRAADESAVDFANRVKAVIARRGGLVDLMWDGQLKRMKPKKEWRELQQEEISKRLKGE